MKKCEPHSFLRNRRIKITEQRLAILEEMLDRTHPVTAQELHTLVSAKINVDLATIYRLLNYLKGHGVLLEISDENGCQHFEVACSHNPEHPHFRCRQCQKLFCLKSLGAKIRNLWAALTTNFSVEEVSLNLRGVCPQCKGHSGSL